MNRYDELIAKEAKHWGEAKSDRQNPQIWDDEQLFEIFFGREYRHLVDTVVASGPRALELGCGEGNLALELARRGLQVDAVDLSPDRIGRAKLKTDGESNRPSFMVGDLNTISLQPQAYDCIVAHDALHHILRLDHLLKEVAGALKSHGTFVVMDYIGMGRARRLCAAFLIGILPTYQPYGSKLKLAKRLKAFLATEDQKRMALSTGVDDALHQDSPFEEISQQSIVKLIHSHFHVLEESSFDPFWYYLAAKVRLPKSLRLQVARMLRAFDDFMVRAHLVQGAYVFIRARKS
ncbi:MAG: class I SAM-dependent methyltransferase [Bacteroidota bacterium]